jgi:hypothetical protein
MISESVLLASAAAAFVVIGAVALASRVKEPDMSESKPVKRVKVDSQKFIYFSADDGRTVSPEYAEANPTTTFGIPRRRKRKEDVEIERRENRCGHCEHCKDFEDCA